MKAKSFLNMIALKGGGNTVDNDGCSTADGDAGAANNGG